VGGGSGRGGGGDRDRVFFGGYVGVVRVLSSSPARDSPARGGPGRQPAVPSGPPGRPIGEAVSAPVPIVCAVTGRSGSSLGRVSAVVSLADSRPSSSWRSLEG
jgi:hypothetical protein